MTHLGTLNGIVVSKTDGTYVARTITAGTGITVTNGDGTAGNPTVAVNGSVVGETITGNSGGAISPTSGNWNLVTANSTPEVVGVALGSNLTLDFGLSNLLLGSDGAVTSGVANVGVGLAALNLNSTGSSNVAIGFGALQTQTGGNENIAIGRSSIRSATSSFDNIGIGFETLASLTGTNGSNNVAIGNSALDGITTGDYNIAIGNGAGGQNTTSDTSNIYIGNNGNVGESHKIRIGTSGSSNGQQNATFIVGINGVNVGSVASVVSISGDQLGSTTITAGSGITVTPGANTITLAASGGGLTWSVITADQSAVVNNGYICNKGSALLLTLPASAAIGNIIKVTGINTALGWKIVQNANQQIFFGNQSTTSGITGFLQSAATRDSVELVCVVSGASTIYNVISSVGNISVS